mgnify:CR=1 FL=1
MLLENKNAIVYGGGGEIHYFALPSTLQAGLEERIIKEGTKVALLSFGTRLASLEYLTGHGRNGLA